MPVWLLPFLVKLLVAVLEKTGFISHAEKVAVKFGVKVVEEVQDIKTYSDPDKDFPHGKNGA